MSMQPNYVLQPPRELGFGKRSHSSTNVPGTRSVLRGRLNTALDLGKVPRSRHYFSHIAVLL